MLLIFATLIGLLKLQDAKAVDSSEYQREVMDSSQQHKGETDLDFDDMRVMDLVRYIVKEEMDKDWSMIVADLTQKVATQDMRIKHLEAREKRRGVAIERLVARVVNLEKEQRHGHNAVVSSEKERVKTKAGQISRWDERHQEHQSLILGSVKGRNEQFRGHWKKPTAEPLPISKIRRRLATRAATHVAFTAYLDHEISHLMPAQAIILNQVLENSGGGYDSKTGIFTAPVDGTYLFSFHFASNHRYTRLRLVVDHAIKVEAVSGSHNDFDIMAGNTVVLWVMAGQDIWVDNHSPLGAIKSDETYRFCTFTGVLLYS